MPFQKDHLTLLGSLVEILHEFNLLVTGLFDTVYALNPPVAAGEF
jgi:hypothetical protein